MHSTRSKKEDRPQLEQILLDLQAEGRITLSKRGKYSKSEIKKTVGVFTAHQRGFGFVTVEGEPDDIFIPAEYVNGAMHMDTVEITISPVTTGRRKEGKVVSVIERGMKQVVCTYEASDNLVLQCLTIPDLAQIFSYQRNAQRVLCRAIR